MWIRSERSPIGYSRKRPASCTSSGMTARPNCTTLLIQADGVRFVGQRFQGGDDLFQVRLDAGQVLGKVLEN